jgi:hypothetical protein
MKLSYIADHDNGEGGKREQHSAKLLVMSSGGTNRALAPDGAAAGIVNKLALPGNLSNRAALQGGRA